MKTTTAIRRESDLTVMTCSSFRLPVELKADLDDLARSAQTDATAIIAGYVEALVAANRERIDDFRKFAEKPLLFPTAPAETDEDDEDAAQE